MMAPFPRDVMLEPIAHAGHGMRLSGEMFSQAGGETRLSDKRREGSVEGAPSWDARSGESPLGPVRLRLRGDALSASTLLRGRSPS
jgi:hypothetical protein